MVNIRKADSRLWDVEHNLRLAGHQPFSQLRRVHGLDEGAELLLFVLHLCFPFHPTLLYSGQHPFRDVGEQKHAHAGCYEGNKCQLDRGPHSRNIDLLCAHLSEMQRVAQMQRI